MNLTDKKLVYVLDDEVDILSLIEASLNDVSLVLKSFSDYRQFENAVVEQLPDLIILDLMLPGKDGLDICKQIKRAFPQVIVLMLTARGDITDKVLGLELGADDYITKPFHPKELLARVRAFLRRTHLHLGVNTNEEQENVRNVGSRVVIDFLSHQVREDGRNVTLTFAEFSILDLLSSKKRVVFSREKILDFVWGQDKVVTDRSVDVHIAKLRSKLKSISIVGVRSVGYKLEVA